MLNEEELIEKFKKGDCKIIKKKNYADGTPYYVCYEYWFDYPVYKVIGDDSYHSSIDSASDIVYSLIPGRYSVVPYSKRSVRYVDVS